MSKLSAARLPRSQDIVYEPRGAQIDVWECGRRITVYSGRTRIGKTTLCCHKAQTLCKAYPGARVLFLRQTRKSMSQSVLKTFEAGVLVRRWIRNPKADPENRSSYTYKNGSEIVVGGMDNPDKYLSGEYDLIIIFQAEECGRDAVMKLQHRLVHFACPVRQLILDVNPREANHWIKTMSDGEQPQARMITGFLQDNPKFYDWDRQEWTPAGLEILEGDKYLSESDYKRLALGIWCSPEGARFKNASRHKQGFDIHEIFPLGIPDHWKRWLAADWGISDPYCCLWFTRSPGGWSHPLINGGKPGMYYFVYQEDYERGFEAHEQILRIVDPSVGSPVNEKYEGIWMDPSLWTAPTNKEGKVNRMAESLGATKERGSAAAQYWAEIKKPEHKGRFGVTFKGHKDQNEGDYVILAGMLDLGELWISRSCTHCWDELEGAVVYKDPRTGISSEMINPGKKLCPDHALKCLCYGLVDRTTVSSDPESTAIDLEAGRAEQLRRQVAARGGSKLPKWVK